MAVMPFYPGMVALLVLLCLPPPTQANIRYLRTVAFSARRTQPVPAPASLAAGAAAVVGGYDSPVRPGLPHFDRATGVFTAPFRGVYALGYNFHQDRRASSGPDETSSLQLVRRRPAAEGSGDEAVEEAVFTAQAPPAPVDSPITVPGSTVLLELERGDEVFLAAAGSVDAAASRPISFSGYLLTRL